MKSQLFSLTFHPLEVKLVRVWRHSASSLNRWIHHHHHSRYTGLICHALALPVRRALVIIL